MTLVQNEPKKIYIYVEAQPVTTAGIYHNADLGLISLSSDGSTWLTIADKNLGATSTDVTSTDSYGYFYQWGNCYGFPTTGSVVVYGATVDASSYGPGNYYTEEHWRRQDPWDYTNNNNLWGGVTGTNEAMKGPCDTGFHIPTNIELQSLLIARTSITWHSTSDISYFSSELLIPRAGERRTNDGARINDGNYVWIWASNVYNNSNGYVLVKDSAYIRVTNVGKSYGCNIRPFKNEAVQPREGEEWVKLYGLLSFNEIVELLQSNATAGYTELNTYAEAYYNKFYAEGKIDYNDTNPFLSANGTPSGQVIDSNGTSAGYWLGEKIREGMI